MKNLVYQLMIAVDPKDIDYTGHATDADKVVQNAVNTAYWIAGAAAVVVIVIAGYVYITARGDAGKLKQARNAIVAALTGIVIILSAFIITQFIIFGVTQ